MQMNEFLEKHKYKILLGCSIFVVTGFSYYMISSNDACYRHIKNLELQIQSQNIRLIELENEPVKRVEPVVQKQIHVEKPTHVEPAVEEQEVDDEALDAEIESELKSITTTES